MPVALEPIAALFDWPDDELSEADFLVELLDRTGAWLLLDVANVYANATNRGAPTQRRCWRGCRWSGCWSATAPTHRPKSFARNWT